MGWCFFPVQTDSVCYIIVSKCAWIIWNVVQCCFPYWGQISGWCLGSLVIMESNHDEVPVSITHVPSNPCRGVSVQHQRQQDQIGYSDDGAGQYDHKTHKHLPKHRLRMLVRVSTSKKQTKWRGLAKTKYTPCQTFEWQTLQSRMLVQRLSQKQHQSLWGS